MTEGQNSNMCDCFKSHSWCKKISAVVFAFIIAFIVVGMFNHDGRGDKNANQDTIVVSGKGELTVKPDIAELSFSVTNENLDVSKASDAVNTKIAAIVAKLKADGVAEADIKTTGYSIDPQYNYVNDTVPANMPYYSSGRQVLAGYNVTDSIDVKIRDLSKAGAIVTDLGTLGATNMSGLTFTEDKYDDLVIQARDQAIADARDQAEKLAKALGVKLGKIVGYSEGSGPIYYGMGVANSAPMAMSKSIDAVLPTGTNKITSNVSVTYELK